MEKSKSRATIMERIRKFKISFNIPAEAIVELIEKKFPIIAAYCF